MAQVLYLFHPFSAPLHSSSSALRFRASPIRGLVSHRTWSSLQYDLQCNGRFACLFSDGSKQEQAKKALEGALGGKKTEYEKWDKEIKRREEAGGGDRGGGGGWFGWRRWFGGSDDNFWQESKQAGLTILGIITMYLIISKGDVLLAVAFNPLLFALRGTRTGLTFVTSQVLRKVPSASDTSTSTISSEEVYTRDSAKEKVSRKWGTD